MKYSLLLFAVLLSAAGISQQNSITVTGFSSRELSPDKIIIHVNINDESCSPELPNIEAATARYVAITKSLGVPASDNVLIKQRQKPSGDRTYSYHTYKLVLKTEDDFEVLNTSLGLDPDYYSGGTTYSVEVVERSYPNQVMVQTEVREQAFRNAEQSAIQLAKLAGRKLGAVTEIFEPDNTAYMFTEVPLSAGSNQQVISYLIRLTYTLLP